MFLALMFPGLAVVALWLHVRYPARRPASLVRAGLHVVVSFVLLDLVPDGLSFVLTRVPPSPLRLCLALALLIPAVTYWLLSWIWLAARIAQDLGGPRGGLPVARDAN